MYDPAHRKVLTYRWLIFWVMAVGYIFVYFHRLCPSVVAVDIQQAFNASGVITGLLASAYFYPYAFMQFPAGLLADSLGPRVTVTCFLTLAAVGSFIFGLAPSMDVAVGARVMVGLGVSMVFISTMKILSQWFRVSEFAFMAAILNTMGGVGALTAASPLAFMSGWVGWRVSFQIIAAGTLLMALLVWISVRNRPQDKGWPSIAEIDHTGPGSSASPRVIPLWEGARRVFSEKYFWPVAIWFFFLLGVFFGFGGLWAGHYLVHVYGMTPVDKGNVLSMIAVGLIVGSPLLSFLSDRVFYSRKKVLMLSSAVLLALVLVLNVFPDGLATWMLYVWMLFFSISSSAIVAIGFTTTKELFPIEIAGTSVGAVNLFPFLGGAVFQPVLGWVLEQYPRTGTGAYSPEAYRALLLTLLGAAVIALIASFFMKETFPSAMRKYTEAR